MDKMHLLPEKPQATKLATAENGSLVESTIVQDYAESEAIPPTSLHVSFVLKLSFYLKKRSMTLH